MATISHETYDQAGNLIQTQTITVPDSVVNADTLRNHITQAIQTFEDADRNWATLTAAQRNDVMKQAVRAIARLARIVNNQLDAT